MKKHLLGIVILLLIFSCGPGKKLPSKVKDDGVITFKLVQLNDVYEIAPTGGGKVGGLARVAHVVDSLKKAEPNTYLFMAGDFLNPSLLGTIKYEGKRIHGKQMIDVMNAMDFELATFGNHEFDIGESDLQQRLNESNFYWTTANVFQQGADGPRSFYFLRGGDTIYIPETYTLDLKDTDGTEASIGFFSVTLNANPRDFVYYGDVMIEAGSSYARLQMEQVDLIMGLTHVKIDQDIEIAKAYPEIAFIMGGHEHNSMMVESGNAKIAKADANAKTIYVHSGTYDKKKDALSIDSELVVIDDRIAEKPSVKAIVDRWGAILDAQIKQVVDDPYEVIYHAEVPLDGTDKANRSTQTNLGAMLAEAMALSFKTPVDGAIVNGGSIRLDDVLVGEVTSLDMFRVLPFGGPVVKIDIKGTLLKEVLDYGKSHFGEGAYLQRYNISENSEGQWEVGGKLIDPLRTYKIACTDFLLKGLDIPILKTGVNGLIAEYFPSSDEPAHDIRSALIEYFKTLK